MILLGFNHALAVLSLRIGIGTLLASFLYLVQASFGIHTQYEPCYRYISFAIDKRKEIQTKDEYCPSYGDLLVLAMVRAGEASDCYPGLVDARFGLSRNWE